MGMWTQADREIHRETRKRYPSDLTDGEWALTVPFFATYRPLSTTIRAIVEACLYLVAEGCRWRALPKDFPPWQTVRWWWDRFRREGVWDRATRAPARGAHRRRPGRRAPNRPRRQPERALRPPEGGTWLGRRQEDQRSQAPRPDVLRRLPPRRHGDRRQHARQARPRPAARARPRGRLAPAAAGRRWQLRRRGRRRRRRPARRDPHRRRAPAGAPGLRPDPAPLARRAGLRHPDDPQQASRPRLGAAAGGVRDDDARRQSPSPHPCCRSGMLKSNRVSATRP